MFGVSCRVYLQRGTAQIEPGRLPYTLQVEPPNSRQLREATDDI